MRSLVCLFALLLTSTALANVGKPAECDNPNCKCEDCDCVAKHGACHCGEVSSRGCHNGCYGLLRGGQVFCRDAPFMARGPVRRLCAAPVRFFAEVKPVRRALRFTGRVLTGRGPILSGIRARRCN